MKTGMKLLTHCFFCFLAVLLFLKNKSLGNTVFLYGLLLSLISCFYYVVREKAEKFWLFAGLHLVGILAAVLLMTKGGNENYSGYFCLAIVIYSVVIRYVPIDLDAPRYLHLPLFILVYYMVPAYQTLCLYMTTAFFLMVLLYNNLESMDFYVATRSLTVSVDEKELKRSTRSVSLIYIGILGLVLGIVGIVHTNQVWKMIGRMLRTAIRFIFSLFTRKESDNLTDETAEEEAGEMMPILPEEAGGSSRLAEILSDIIQFVFIAALIVGVLVLIVKVIVWFYHYFYESKLQEDTNIVVERVARLDRKVNKRHPLKRNSDKKSINRIRKLYRKLLKKKGAKGIANIHFLSPKGQLERLCKPDYNEQELTELQQLYEKARYGDTEISAEDIARFKTIYNERNNTR